MAAPFVLLFGLLVFLAYPTGLEPLRFAEGPAAPLAALGVLVLHAALCLVGRGRGPRARALLTAASLVEYAALVYLVHWPLWTWLPWIEASPLLSTLAGLAPLLALVALQGAITLKPGRRAFAFRAGLALAGFPLLAMLSAQEAVERIPVLREAALLVPSLAAAASWVAVFAVGAALPRLLRFVFAAHELPPGPLRDRLEARCRAMRFAHGGLYRVPSGGPSGTANAFVAGLFIRRRPVFFTETLLDGLDPEAVEGVLAHEVTHALRGHLGTYLMVGAGFVGLGAGLQALAPGLPDWAMLASASLGAILFWGVLFRALSRRFECEADLGAARALAVPGEAPFAGAPVMVRALERVAALNGAPLDAGSLRHYSAARRIAVLQRAWEAPGEGLLLELACRRARIAVGIAFAAALLAGAGALVREAGEIEARRRWMDGVRAAEEGEGLLREARAAEALERFQSALAAGVDVAPVWRGVAVAQRALGRLEEAAEAERRARARTGSDPRERRALPGP